MKIKQIELIGFKSFSERTLLYLHDGITCFVGPNGCGKSNVSDAFRWVLGEQSAKSLRGDRMEDVIFHGTDTKKSKGMADVTLTFSRSVGGKPENGNGGSKEDSEGDEIIVSRRLYRSGESEYLLNKRQCRLKDIRDIFLDTGLDVKSYSILDQGKIADIVNAKPVDRRFLIEEVAGVMKYKVRKAEALSKLESSKQNLQRINDIVYEVKRQINSLDRQVKKAERYKRLIEELKELELRVFKREFLGLSAILKGLMADIERLRELDSTKRSGLSDIENRLETRRLALVEREKALEEIEKHFHEKERELADAETRSAVLKKGLENHRADIERLTRQKEEAVARREDLEKKAAELSESEASLTANTADISGKLESRKSYSAEIEENIKSREQSLDNKRKDLFKASETVSERKNELQRLHATNDNLTYQEGVSLRDIDTIRAELAEMKVSIADAEAFIQTQTIEHRQLQEQRDALRVDIDRTAAGIEDKKARLSIIREELASATARMNSLKELLVDRTLSDVLAESQSSEGHGYEVLSDILSANKEYEKAIEAVLSEKVNSLIIENLDELLKAVSIIKEKKLGKTSLLFTGCLNSENPASEALTEDGVLGRTSDFISFEKEESRKKAAGLFENTYIVKDLRSAVALRGNNNFRNKILVTLDGEVIDVDGIIFAGQGREILKKKREIKELQQLIAEQQQQISDTENDLASLAANLNEKKGNLSGIENRIVEIEKDLSLANHSFTGQREEYQRRERKLSLLETDLMRIAGEKASLNVLLASKSSEISALESEVKNTNEAVVFLQQQLAETRKEYEVVQAGINELNVSVATIRERLNALKNELGGVQNTIAELEKIKETAAQDVLRAESHIKASLDELSIIENNMKVIASETAAMSNELSSRREGIDTEKQALADEGTVLKAMRMEIDAITQELNETNTNAVTNKLKIENIEHAVSQKYGLNIAEEQILTDGFEPAEDLDKIDQISEKIRDLGPVNLGTIEEYEELKTRYDFLTKQQQDLTMSIAELEEAISRINVTTKKKLREAYDTLRTKFGEVFANLFSGGRADIILTDEENILESGIEIIAQPPGKKLQNLNLLSGGEKALTSLSLLFAGFLIKPSPLCILDEADAPLDESNTVRFAQMIKDLSTETQFIVITHNRMTMEKADYLYGVTMEEKGVSKTLSLQFSEIENVVQN